jgi:hypothetical protein
MKKLLGVSAAILLILWAVMFFVWKNGDVSHIILALAGMIIFFLYSLRRVIT